MCSWLCFGLFCWHESVISQCPGEMTDMLSRNAYISLFQWKVGKQLFQTTLGKSQISCFRELHYYVKKEYWWPIRSYCYGAVPCLLCLAYIILRLGAQSVTLLSTLRDPTQSRRRQCACRHKKVPLAAKKVRLETRGFCTHFLLLTTPYGMFEWKNNSNYYCYYCFGKKLKFLLLIRRKE